MIKIRQLLQSEIHFLENMPPKEWNMNLPELVSFHFGYQYYYPIAAEVDSKIVGFGQGILNGKIGWIGCILVNPEYRRQGIGHLLTNHLVEYFKSKHCTGQLLIASDMGQNIYSRIGFKITTSYLNFICEDKQNKYAHSEYISEISEKDYHNIKKLDFEISGEKRFHFLERYLKTGFVYKDEGSYKIKGYYLPELGGGLILADNSEAGIELIKFRANQGKKNVFIPAENKTVIEFLQNEGYQQYQSLPRMVLGEEVNWKPGCIFNRGAGYCG